MLKSKMTSFTFSQNKTASFNSMHIILQIYKSFNPLDLKEYQIKGSSIFVFTEDFTLY